MKKPSKRVKTTLTLNWTEKNKKYVEDVMKLWDIPMSQAVESCVFARRVGDECRAKELGLSLSKYLNRKFESEKQRGEA